MSTTIQHIFKPGDTLYYVEQIGKVHEIVLNKNHFECNHTYLNYPNPVIYGYILKPNEPVIEKEDHSLVLWIAQQMNGQVTYTTTSTFAYVDKTIAEKVAAKIKNIREKLKFKDRFKAVVFVHPISNRIMSSVDIKSSKLQENLEYWQKQYKLEKIPFQMYLQKHDNVLLNYMELRQKLLDYLDALELKEQYHIY